MDKKDIQILQTIAQAIPKMTDAQKAYLMAFGEGMALMAERSEQKGA